MAGLADPRLARLRDQSQGSERRLSMSPAGGNWLARLPTLHSFPAKQAFAAKAHLLHVSVARTLRILTFIVLDLSKL
jgi:hypothetical protein